MQQLAYYVSKYGLSLIFVNVLLEQLGLPIPAIPVLVVAGALAVERDLSVRSRFARRRPRFAHRGCPLVRARKAPRLPDPEDPVPRLAFARLLRPADHVDFREVGTALARGREVRARLLDRGASAGRGHQRPVSSVSPVRRRRRARLGGGRRRRPGWRFTAAIDRGLEFLTGIGSWALVLLGAALVLFISGQVVAAAALLQDVAHGPHLAGGAAPPDGRGARPVVLDVRTGGARLADPRRIPGAKLLEMSDIPEKLAGLPQDREIILYCT